MGVDVVIRLCKNYVFNLEPNCVSNRIKQIDYVVSGIGSNRDIGCIIELSPSGFVFNLALFYKQLYGAVQIIQDPHGSG